MQNKEKKLHETFSKLLFQYLNLLYKLFEGSVLRKVQGVLIILTIWHKVSPLECMYMNTYNTKLFYQIEKYKHDLFFF